MPSFPLFFKRYVELGSDVKISVDLRRQKENDLLDRVKLEESYAVLRSLRDVILQIVRSLSKFGTRSTSIANNKWSEFSGDALDVLIDLGEARTNVDVDERTPWSVLQLLTNKLDTEIMPHAALFRHGYQLLRYAVDIYAEHGTKLESNESDKLVGVFQPEGKPYWTARIREQVDVLQRYPLESWG